MGVNWQRINFIQGNKSVKMLVIRKNGVAYMGKEKDDLQKEEEEKEFLLEYIKMQNEAMKRIFKNTLDKEENE